MPKKTIEYLLSLKVKDTDRKKLDKEINKLVDTAEDLGEALEEATDPQQVKKLDREIDKLNDGLLEAVKSTSKLDEQLEKASKSAATLEELGGKLTQVGGFLAGSGAALLAPIALAANKYVDAFGETEETSARMLAISQQFEDVQLRIGRIAAEQLLPLLEKGIVFAEKVADFIEANPGIIKAAIGIGGTLAAAGAVIASAGVVVQTLGAVQKIATIAGVPLGGGGGIGAALGPAFSSALTSAAPVIVPILAIAIGAEIGRRLVEVVTGQEYTWQQIGQDFKNLFVLSAEGWDILFNWLGLETNISGVLANAFNTSDLFMIEKLEAQGNSIKDGLENSIRNLAKEHARAVREAAINTIEGFRNSLRFVVDAVLFLRDSFIDAVTRLPALIATAFTAAIRKLIDAIPGKAGGGEISAPGLFFGGEQGREYVMNNKTTRAAESIIGGKLSQENLLAAISRGRVQYNDNRRFEATPSPFDRRKMRDEMVTALSGVFS